MNSQIFRKASIEKVSSPEQLDAYIRVSSPGVWMVLAAVLVLLVGVCVWGVMGHLDTAVSVAAVSTGGEVTVYVKAENATQLETGMPVRIGEQEFTLDPVPAEPVAVDGGFSEYALHVGGLRQGEWVYAVTVSGGSLPEGIYEANIVVESVSPMSFVLN